MGWSRVPVAVAVVLCFVQIVKLVNLELESGILFQDFDTPTARHQGRQNQEAHTLKPGRVQEEPHNLSLFPVDLRLDTTITDKEIQNIADKSNYHGATEVPKQGLVDSVQAEAQQDGSNFKVEKLQSERNPVEEKANRQGALEALKILQRQVSNLEPVTTATDTKLLTTQPETPKASKVSQQKDSKLEPATQSTDDKLITTVDTTSLFLFSESNCSSQVHHVQVQGSEPIRFKGDSIPKSVKLQGSGFVEVHQGAKNETYLGVIVEQDGCFDVVAFSKHKSFKHLTFDVYSASSSNSQAITHRKQIPEFLQRQFSTAKNLSEPHTRIIFSAESSHYFGFQVLASAFSFLDSNQTNASWMRLLTAQQPDDLSERFPTFTAPRSLESNLYSPISKPDVIMKWFQSKDAPHPDDIIVVIDPDSWLLTDMGKWVANVGPKRAKGQFAYYHNERRLCQNLWHEFCLKNCNVPIDLVGVGNVGSKLLVVALSFCQLIDDFASGALFGQSL
jgi:hypothetical protein